MDWEEMRQVVKELEMPPFSVSQIMDWVYVKKAPSIACMTNLSQKSRERLDTVCEVGFQKPVESVSAPDGTVKYLFEAPAGAFVEAVYIPDGERATLCLSSQVGCKMGCRFCMTGKQGFTANLTAGDILNQFYALPGRDTLTNIVFMGMGEPCDNLDEVLKALRLFTDPKGLAWSPRRITVSTVGLKKGLRRLVEESECHLAISLHSPTHDQRESLIPAEHAFEAAEMVQLLRGYDFSHQRRLSFEYILFKGVNDSLRSARELIDLLHGLDCRVNLIGYHSIPSVDLQGLSRDEMITFRDYLTAHGLFATLRASRGEEIFAACGMLSTDKKKKVDETK